MRQSCFLMCVSACLAGCGVLPDGLLGTRDRPDPVPQVVPADPETDIPDGARTAEEFDTSSADARNAALAGATDGAAQTNLGVTIASLGDVSETGIWLKTPLVDAPIKGRVEFAEGGTAVALDLIPLEADAGAGSRISLAAMRLLEVDLTSLAELRVYRLD